MKKIIITEQQLDTILAKKENNPIELFKKEVKNFIYCLLTDNSEFSDYWRINNLKKKDVYKKLIKYRIIEIINNEIKVPKKRFDKKIIRLYYEIFNEEPGFIISEDDGGMVATGDSPAGSIAANSGSYETPLSGGVIRKKIYY